MIGAVMTVLDASIVNVSLPYMQKSFGAGIDRITWVVTSYLVAVERDDSDDRMVRGALRAQALFPRFGADVRDRFRDVRAGRRRWPDGDFRLLQGAAGAAMIPLRAGDTASKPFRPTSTRWR